MHWHTGHVPHSCCSADPTAPWLCPLKLQNFLGDCTLISKERDSISVPDIVRRVERCADTCGPVDTVWRVLERPHSVIDDFRFYQRLISLDVDDHIIVSGQLCHRLVTSHCACIVDTTSEPHQPVHMHSLSMPHPLTLITRQKLTIGAFAARHDHLCASFAAGGGNALIVCGHHHLLQGGGLACLLPCAHHHGLPQDAHQGLSREARRLIPRWNHSDLQGMQA